ncbi:DoxX family protein [Paenibacillus sp. GP183]|jgi:putative oxidoreductase|uniref:DoxX family protein n=1 Tax=Paenibacillus sp. GP183 TaxID=1882751 RepID=UPI000897C3FB|nr:DoxX family protein [Paenibacillus sp. GP183]SEB99248.1 DoxX-like family protein [Paenibacillus sp. GP183]
MAILAIVLQSLLALMFLMAGVGKLSGSKMHVENFKKWGYPQWFRVVTGIVEFVGAAALIVGYWDKNWTAVGSLILGITSIGGIIVHIRNKDSFKETIPILVLAIISFIVFFIR